MTKPFQAPLSRRLLLSAASGPAALLLLTRSPAAAIPTPRQTEGPFYSPELPADADADLVRVTGADAQALGQVTHLRGRVLDGQGRPVPNAVVEIWQCDANGRYLHPGDRAGRRDPGFQGFGRVATEPGGGYRFRTIRPVAYPGRAPHIHVKVRRDGRELLTTQMYVAGEPLNDRDGLYRRLDAQERERVTIALSPATATEAGALVGTFEIVVPA